MIYDTPLTCPRASTSIRSTMALLCNSQLPLATARGTTVFCVPFFALVGHANPTQYLHPMHAARPWYSSVLISNGTGLVIQPSRCAPFASASVCGLGGTGGNG